MASKPKPPVENKNPESIPIYCAYDELLPIEQLKPNPKNNNIHPDEQIKLLAKLIENHGWRLPITVSNLSGCIVRGHGKLMAARLLGADVVPVDFQDYKDYAQELADLMADNKIPELSLFDDDLTRELLSEIKELDADFDMELTGFSDEELNVIFDLDDPTGPIEGEDDIPDPPAEPKSKLGDLYQLGRHRLLCGDSTKREDVERLMGGEKADMVFTSPPYTDQRDYHIGKFSWDDLILNVFENIISLVAGETTHILVNLGVAHKDRMVDFYWDNWLKFMAVHEYPLFGWYVWDKLSGMCGEWNGRLAPAHEFVFHFNKKCESANKWIETNYENSSSIPKKTFRQKDGSLDPPTSLNKFGQEHKIPDSVIRITRASTAGSILAKCPAVYPVKLPEFGCMTWTYENDLVYEPFGGSGSTLIACEKTNRKCFMMEIDPIYIDVIIQRWETFTGQKAVKL